MQTSEWNTINRLHRKVSSVPHEILCHTYRKIRVIRTSFDQLALAYYLQICQKLSNESVHCNRPKDYPSMTSSCTILVAIGKNDI